MIGSSAGGILFCFGVWRATAVDSGRCLKLHAGVEGAGLRCQYSMRTRAAGVSRWGMLMGSSIVVYLARVVCCFECSGGSVSSLGNVY